MPANRTWLALGIAVLAITPHAGAQIIVNPGQSIQDAIDTAPPGSEIIVRGGTYNQTIDLRGKALNLRGGVDGTTVINGAGLNDTVVRCDSGEPPGTIIQNFTITGGVGQGGGLRIVDASPIIYQCIITGNRAPDGVAGAAPTDGQNAGGVYCENANAYFERCTITENEAGDGRTCLNPFEISNGGHGGGMYITGSTVELIRCTITENLTGQAGFDCQGSPATRGGDGGGIYAVNSNLRLDRALILFNATRRHAGGLDNQAHSGHGGGIHAVDSTIEMRDSLLSNNDTGRAYGNNGGDAGHGAGASLWNTNLLAIKSGFIANNCGNAGPGQTVGNGGRGGGIYFNNSPDSILVNCRISVNAAGSTEQTDAFIGAGGDGGGAYCHGQVTFIGCLIEGNLAGDGHAGFNGAGNGGLGGAIRCGVETALINCTVVANQAGKGLVSPIFGQADHGVGAGLYVPHGNTTITNSIIALNSGAGGINDIEQVFPPSVDISVYYSQIPDISPVFSGFGNTGADVVFVDPAGPDGDLFTIEDNNYRLGLNAPAIDAGDTSALPLDTFDIDEDFDTSEVLPLDFDHDPRVQDAIHYINRGVTDQNGDTVDMGCYEADALIPACICETAGDPALVDVLDLLQYIALWFQQDPSADLNADSVTDVLDLLDFLACWFPASDAGTCT